jgi:hypothetical protein
VHTPVGIYAHPAPADSGFKSTPVSDSYTNQFLHFLSANIVKQLLWLRKLPPLE